LAVVSDLGQVESRRRHAKGEQWNRNSDQQQYEGVVHEELNAPPRLAL